jgi:hypothetical protein
MRNPPAPSPTAIVETASAPDTAATENATSELDEEDARATAAADKATAAEDPPIAFV